MRILVVGAGAIGGLLAGAFANAGHEVGVVVRGAHLDAIRRDGLVVRWIDRDAGCYRVAASDRPEDFGPQDAIVIALKGYSIAAMLPRLAGLLRPETAVVTAINGIPWWYFARHGGRYDGMRIECLDPDGAMARALDPRYLIGGVVHTAAEVVAPGVVQHTSGRLHFLGELDGRDTPRLAAICAAIDAGGLAARSSAVIRNEVWMKLIGNLAYNPLATLTLARMDEVNRNADLLSLIHTLMTEGMAVAEAYGQPITISIEERIELARKVGAAKVSMHQDLDKRRPLEIDAISGAVVELARKAGVRIPITEAIHALISERARHN